MSSVLSIEVRDTAVSPSARIVVFKGEIDETHIPEMEKVLDKLAADKRLAHIVFDFRDLIFINSKGIGFIASFYASLAQEKKKLLFAAANENIRDILSLVGLTEIIPSFDTVDSALTSMKS